MINFLLLCATAGLLTACSLPTRAPVTPTSWVVMPERTGAPLKPRTDFWLKVASVTVAPPFDTKSLVYRLGDTRYEKDFYNVYATIPSEMIGSAERQWLNKANIFLQRLVTAIASFLVIPCRHQSMNSMAITEQNLRRLLVLSFSFQWSTEVRMAIP